MKILLFTIGIAFTLGLGTLWLHTAPLAAQQAKTAPSQPQQASSSLLLAPDPQTVPSWSATSSTSTDANHFSTFSASTSRSASAAAPATHIIGQVTLSPSIVTAGSVQPIKITALISDPALIATSVNLIYSRPGGSTSTIVGVLHDDGLNGDAIAGDTIYSIVFRPATVLAGELDFQISAAFRGALIRTKSSIIRFVISAAPNRVGWQSLSDSSSLFTISVPPTWGLHIAEVQNPNPDTVKTCEFLFPDGSKAFAIDVYTPAGWQDLISSGGGIVPLIIGTSTNYYFTLEQSQDIEGTQGLTADQELSQLPAIYATFSPK